MDPRPAHGAHDEEKAYAEDVAFGAVQDEHIDLGGYVLGSLSGAETISFEAHLAQCAACQAELEELGGLPEMLDLAAFAGWDVVPGGTRRPSEASSALQAPVPVAAAVPTAPVTPLGQRRPRGRRPAVWIGAAAAAVVAVALAVGATALSRRDTLPQGTQVALIATAGQSASGTAMIRTGGNGTLVELHLRGLNPTAGGERFECWWAAGGQKVSAGSFTVGPDGVAKVNLTVSSSRTPPWKLNVNRVDSAGQQTNVLFAETKAA